MRKKIAFTASVLASNPATYITPKVSTEAETEILTDFPSRIFFLHFGLFFPIS